MDRNFHNDDFDFERLLREKSDEFRMYPSKRIWHSIYNNIHPARKWPSVAMTITLITALFLVGYLNTKQTNPGSGDENNFSYQQNISQANTSTLTSIHLPVNAASLQKPALPGTVENSLSIEKTDVPGTAAQPELLAPGTLLTDRNHAHPSTTPLNAGHSPVNAATTTQGAHPIAATEAFSFPGTIENSQPISREETFTSQLQPDPGHEMGLSRISKVTPEKQPLAIELPSKIPADMREAGLPGAKNDVAVNTKQVLSLEDRNWIENYALYNRPATKKWANKLSWQLYATPSFVFRSLYEDVNFGYSAIAPNTPPLAVSPNTQDINKTVNQKSALGFEVGSGLLYAITSKIRLKGGLQLNYTRYNAEAFQNTHPVATKMTMHDYQANIAYEASRTTPYSNKSGLEAIKLHNETFQVSLPIGADLKIIGNDVLQWNLGVTIQPTYVIGGRSYVISSDRRNYVQESAMLNKWNLNAGFETFVSYKAPNGISFQFGPQFRSQFFSTNHKQVAVQEKLQSYGLKFGISKTIK